MSSSYWKDRTNFWLWAIAFLNIALHLVFHANLEFHRDELLYFSLGLHPDFGYATVPPLIAWVAFLVQSVFGYSLFAVKLFPALLSGVFVLLTARLTKELNGGTYAQILAAIVIIFTPFALRTFHLFQPVHLDLLFWTLMLFYSVRYVNTEQDKYLVYLGVVAGFGMLNKYLIALLIATLAVALLFSPHRNIFQKKALYKGLVIGLLIFIPNIIWQIFHDLPVIGHMEALNDRQLVNVDRTMFMIDQLLMVYSGSILTIAGLVYLFLKKKFRYLLLVVVLVVGILLFLQGKSYYTLGVFPMLLAAGAVGLERWIKIRWIRLVIPVLIVVAAVQILPMGIPAYKEEGLIKFFLKMEEDYGLTVGRRFEDGTIHSLPQDYADQLGWEELTSVTNDAMSLIPEKEKALIYCSNYGQAGAIAVIGKKYGLPEPISFNESFLYWLPESFDPEIEYLIYINDELGQNVAEFFGEVEIVGSITNPNAREFGTTVYLCANRKVVSISSIGMWSIPLKIRSRTPQLHSGQVYDLKFVI